MRRSEATRNAAFMRHGGVFSKKSAVRTPDFYVDDCPLSTQVQRVDAQMKTILFVCTGNVCRSPMAEGIFRHAVQGRGVYRVWSAGLGAVDGQPPSPYAVQAVKELGIDISHQRSRMLSPELVHHADFIFGMTHSHIDSVMLLYPYAADKTFLLREFDETLDLFEKDISDPIGGSYDVYLNCRDQNEQGIPSLLRFIEHGGAPPSSAPNKLATASRGAAHAAFAPHENPNTTH